MNAVFWLMVALARADEPAPDAPPPESPESVPPAVPPVPPAETPSGETPATEDAPVDENALFGGSVDENALFGGDPPAAEPPPETVTMDGIDMEKTSDSAILDRLTNASDKLTIGGRAYLRLDAAFVEDEKFKTAAFSSPNLLDLFVDARPNDRVRIFAKGRLSHDFTIQSGDTDMFGDEVKPTKVALDSLWMKFDVAHKVYVTAGKQRIKWGAGRFWNPTDFMNQQALDPLAAYDERLGVGLIKVHVPFEKLGANAYFLGNFEGAQSLEEIGGAARLEWAFNSSELSVSAAARKDQPYRLGADFSSALWIFDLRVEASVQKGLKTPFYEGELDFETFTLPTEVSREDDWIPQVVAGLEAGFKVNSEDTFYVGAEYFFNDAGYSDNSLYLWLLANNQFTPFYLGRHYFGAYAYVPSPGRWEDTSFTGSVITNLSDKSAVARLDVRQTVLTYLALNVYSSYHFGELGEFQFQVEVPPVPTVPALANGLTVPAPWLEFGLGANLTF